MKKICLTALGLALTLTSCMVGPHYTPPIICDEPWFGEEETIDEGAPIDVKWWNAFNDPVMSELVEEVATGNLTIQAARERVLQARALRQIALAPLFPWFGANGNYNSSQVSLNGPNGEPFFISTGIARRTNEVYDVNFDAFWELDVFGGKRRAAEAACAEIGFEIASLRGAVLTAVAETARSYIELRGAQKRLALLKKNAKLQEHTLTLVTNKKNLGLAREVDVTRARALLEGTLAQIPDLEGRVQTISYRLSVLTGREPGSLYAALREERPLPCSDDVIPVGLRSEILCRRPDVQQAERQLAAATAEIGVATARLFPSFTLTGDYGYLSANRLSDLITGNSVNWFFDALIRQPLFEGGRLRAEVRLNQFIQSEAAVNYQETVLLALEDAEGALVRYGREREARERRLEEVKAAERSTTLLENLYENGLTDFLDVLVAQREQTQAEDNLAISETAVLTDLVSLYKALGGGWEIDKD